MSTVPISLTWSIESCVASFAPLPPARERRAARATQITHVSLTSAEPAWRPYLGTAGSGARFGRQPVHQPFPAIPNAADDTVARWARRHPAPPAPDPLDAR